MANKIAAHNAGWPSQFRFAGSVFWSGVCELALGHWKPMNTAITIIATMFGTAGTLAAIYFARARYTMVDVPTLDIQIHDCPPYKGSTDRTTISVKNVGARTSGRVQVSLRCTWEDEFDYLLRFPADDWVLRPNEEYRWKVRIGHVDPSPKGKITVSAKESGCTFETSASIS